MALKLETLGKEMNFQSNYFNWDSDFYKKYNP